MLIRDLTMDRILQTWNFAKNVSYSISTLRYSYLHKQQVLLKDKLSQKHQQYTIGIVAAKVICRPSPQRSPCNNCCCCCSVTKSCPTFCYSMDCSMPGSSVLHRLPEFAQTHVRWVSDTIYPSHPLPPTSPALNLSHHQSFFQWVGCLPQVAQVLELQRQSFQWIFRVDFL